MATRRTRTPPTAPPMAAPFDECGLGWEPFDADPVLFGVAPVAVIVVGPTVPEIDVPLPGRPIYLEGKQSATHQLSPQSITMTDTNTYTKFWTNIKFGTTSLMTVTLCSACGNVPDETGTTEHW